MKLLLVFALLRICYAGTVQSQDESSPEDPGENVETVDTQKRATCDTMCMLRRLQNLMYKTLQKRNCPIGYRAYWQRMAPYPTRCFKYSNQRVSWYTALTRCHEDGGHLATVYGSGDRKFLEYLINHQKHYGGPITSPGAWLGATDRHKEGTFVWEATGRKLTYKNFRPGGANTGSKDCVFMYTRAYSKKWDAWYCTGHFNYICEIRLF